MKRGLFVVLALLAGAFVSPASAATSQGVVYEVLRRPSSSDSAEVTVHYLAAKGPTVAITAHLSRRTGGGYDWQSMNGYWSSGSSGGGSNSQRVTLRGGQRFVVGATRGYVRVAVDTKGWYVRESPGFRVLTETTKVRGSVAGVPIRQGGRAVAPAGAYGSLAWIRVGCEPGVGEWSYTTDAGESRSYQCDPVRGWRSDLVTTHRGRRWTVDSESYGVHDWDMRIAVLDFPRV